MPLLALVVVFIVVPFAELYVIVQVVGPALGPIWTILLLAADSVLGALLLKSQGRAVWRRFNEALAAGRMPHREVVDGVLVIFGGAFLITPGFITDILGVLLLLPPSRNVIRSLVMRRLGQRVAVGVAGRAARPRPRPRRERDFDVEGTATEHEPPPPRRLDR